jgi:hypothetical protein
MNNIGQLGGILGFGRGGTNSACVAAGGSDMENTSVHGFQQVLVSINYWAVVIVILLDCLLIQKTWIP